MSDSTPEMTYVVTTRDLATRWRLALPAAGGAVVLAAADLRLWPFLSALVLFGLGIALVLIGMMLMGQAPVGALQILLSRRMTDPQNFVIVALINGHNRKYQ